MSVMFLKQLKLHRTALEARLNKGGGSLDMELAQTRQFLTATKDEKWRRQLLKRIKTLEDARKKGEDVSDVKKRFKMVDDLYQAIAEHPEYNKTRRKRPPKS